MVPILIILLVIVAILLMGVVLIQASKGGGLAGTFGGGGEATAVFGVRRTADFLIKVTTTLATIMLLFSLITNIIINKNLGTHSSFIQDQPQTLPQPNTPNQLEQPVQQPPGDQNQQPADENQQQPPK